MSDKYVFVVDTDGGVDDAIALMMLIGADKKIDFITTTFGNIDLEQATTNVLDVLAVCNADVPVYKGATDSLVGERMNAAHVHGVDGLGGADARSMSLKHQRKPPATRSQMCCAKLCLVDQSCSS